MHKLSFTESCRRVFSSALWIAFATFIVMGLSAGTAAAQAEKIDICHNGHIISVDVHAVPAHLEHGDLLGDCDGTTPCACGQNFDPVTCTLPDGTVRTFANQCFANCAGAVGPCQTLGVCSNIYDPVTCNGQTYANACQARLAGCTIFQVLCPCGLIYAPVRCADGRVYVNACVAQCQGQSGCAPL